MTIVKNIEVCLPSPERSKEFAVSLKPGQIWELKQQNKFAMCLLLKSFPRSRTQYLDWQCLNLDTSTTFFASEMRWFHVSYKDLVGKRIV